MANSVINCIIFKKATFVCIVSANCQVITESQLNLRCPDQETLQIHNTICLAT